MNETKAWECPRCGRINAPHVDRCDCVPQRAAVRWPDKHTTGIPQPPYSIQTATWPPEGVDIEPYWWVWYQGGGSVS